MALIRSCPHALIITMVHTSILRYFVLLRQHIYYTVADISANMLMATLKVTVNMPGLFCFEITGAALILSAPPR